MKLINASVAALTLVALPVTGIAYGQAQTVTVNLSDVAASLATDLDIDADDVPESVLLSADAAAAACDLTDVSDLSSCDAVFVTADISAAVEAGIDDDGGEGDGEDDGAANSNSARDFAPGQQDGPANEAAPGQQDGPARESAPGQVKKNGNGDS